MSDITIILLLGFIAYVLLISTCRARFIPPVKSVSGRTAITGGRDITLKRNPVSRRNIISHDNIDIIDSIPQYRLF